MRSSFNLKVQLIILSSLFSLFILRSDAFSLDPQSAAFSVNAETRDINDITEARKINELLDDLEKNWNIHKIDNVLKYYWDDFVNGDGLNLSAVKNLTVELWDAYPDIKSKSQERTVRVYGEYATVESTDYYQGASAKVREEVGTEGTLKAISIGQLFLKKFGSIWKITSDKTFFEKVSIGYGYGTELIDKNKVVLSAPEQVPGSQQYTVKLDFDIPENVKPVAAISKEVLVYPQLTGEDKFRLVSEPKLEKLLTANKTSKNELITATIGLTGGELKPKLLGLIFLTRRVNIIPASNESAEVSIIKEPAKSALNKAVDLLDAYPNPNPHGTKNEQDENQTKDSRRDQGEKEKSDPDTK